MNIIEVKTNSQIKKYLQFVQSLYRGDSGYCCTQKFNAQSLLYQQTAFAKSCFISPVMVVDCDKIFAVCTFIHNPKLPYLQIGLFEATEDAHKAVELLIRAAKELAARRGLDKILVGMNGHLSYGVGILEENFDGRVSFDSIYNKPYYAALFAPYITQKESLCTYRTSIESIQRRIKPFQGRNRIAVRTSNFKQFAAETETLRRLCDETLIKTSFYTPTDANHFTELMGGLRVFLRNENLLFALCDNKECGFLFWHPDYNSMLLGGRDYNLLQIFFKAKNAYKKATTLKINAIGSHSPFATAALITEMTKYASGNYTDVETTFVWDNNRSSRLLTQKLFGEPYRRYGVYLIDC